VLLRELKALGYAGGYSILKDHLAAMRPVAKREPLIRFETDRSLSQVRIPPTAQAVLAARIDRLPADEKALLQTLAVLGREFQRSSAVEAEAQYRDALSIIKELPPTRERDRLELGVQLGLSAVLLGKGFGASGAGRVVDSCDRTL
jgi:hypothetical protein